MSTITSAMEPFSCASAAACTKVVRKPWAMVAHTHILCQQLTDVVTGPLPSAIVERPQQAWPAQELP